MTENVYIHGVDILGGEYVGAVIPLAQASGPQPALVIRVKNAGELVKKQGGATGSLVFDAVPGAITNVIYGKMRDEFAKKLKEQGVDADVTVSTSPPNGPAPRSDFLPGMAVGAVTVGIGVGLWKLLRGILR